jgi:hypothetical protein
MRPIKPSAAYNYPALDNKVGRWFAKLGKNIDIGLCGEELMDGYFLRESLSRRQGHSHRHSIMCPIEWQ